eukprot:108270_1
MAEQQKDEKKEETRFTLAYWNIQGYAAPARMMLLYSGCKYENIMYDKRNEWYDIKYKMNLDFPNVPYLIDHKTGIRCTESLAIYAYLARQLNIGSTKDPQQLYNDMIIGFMKDFWRSFSDLCYRNYPDGKDKYLKETAPQKLELLENWLKNKEKRGQPRKWFTGDEIAVCDFLVYYLLFANIKLDEKFITKTKFIYPVNVPAYPELKRFYQQFETLPFMKQYKETGLSNLPLNGSSAKFR